LIPFASSPTFGFLYRSTVAYFPAAFILLIAAVKFLEVVIISIVNYGMRKEEKEFEMIQVFNSINTFLDTLIQESSGLLHQLF
jgi:hypothetical protein